MHDYPLMLFVSQFVYSGGGVSLEIWALWGLQD
jgi:hypothetical protein